MLDRAQTANGNDVSHTASTRLLLLLGLIAVLAGVPSAAQAQQLDWPKRLVHFMVPSPAGSAANSIGRILTQKLAESLGQQFVVENRAGASGSIGVEALANAAPDGYTIGIITTSTNAVAAALNPKLPYDPLKSFAPISLIGRSPYVLAIYPGLGPKTLGEFIALAKERPGKISNASFGSTSLGYLASAWFADRTGIKLNDVAYRSSAQAVIDLVGGRIDMQFGTLPPTVSLIRDGKIRAIAVTSAQRVQALADVPSLAEQGLSDYDVSLRIGVAAPAATPPAIVARLNGAITEILNTPAMKTALAEQGFEPEPGTPDVVVARLRTEIETWRDVVNRLGLKEN